MIKKVLVKVLPVAVFVVAGAVTLFAIHKLRGNGDAGGQPQSAIRAATGDARRGTIDGVRGVAENEVVALPELPSLNGGPVALGGLKENHLLVAFVSSKCGGCARDTGFWRDLKDEAAERGIAFYLVNVADDKVEAGKFAEAHGLEGLPLLYDPDGRAARGFKVGFAPQYVLLTAKGQVVERWDGLRHYEGQREQVARMFDRIPR